MFALHHEVIDQRREQVGEQDRQHDALRERRVDHADQHHITPISTPNQKRPVGHGRGHRVGGHEDHAEGEAAHHQVPVPGHGEHRVAVAADRVEQASDRRNMPRNTPSMMRQEATRV